MLEDFFSSQFLRLILRGNFHWRVKSWHRGCMGPPRHIGKALGSKECPDAFPLSTSSVVWFLNFFLKKEKNVFDFFCCLFFKKKHYNAAPLLHVFTITFNTRIMNQRLHTLDKGRSTTSLSWKINFQRKSKFLFLVCQIKRTIMEIKTMPCSSSFTKAVLVSWVENVYFFFFLVGF